MWAKSSLDFFTGGSGTMAKTLAYGILYCLKAPEVMQKVRTNIHGCSVAKRWVQRG